MERIRFLSLESSFNLDRIELIKNWGEVTPSIRTLQGNLKGHVNQEPAPMDAKWTSNVKNMIDNILCTEVCERGFHPLLQDPIEFCYGKFKSFNGAMGTFFESEHDLEERIYDMY